MGFSSGEIDLPGEVETEDYGRALYIPYLLAVLSAMTSFPLAVFWSMNYR